MNKHELNALGHYTCEYPEDKTFEEILKLIEDDSDDVIIWEPFEDYRGEEIAELISQMADSLKYSYEKKG